MENVGRLWIVCLKVVLYKDIGGVKHFLHAINSIEIWAPYSFCGRRIEGWVIIIDYCCGYEPIRVVRDYNFVGYGLCYVNCVCGKTPF